MNNLLLLSTICFVAMISPGPDFLLVTKNALNYPKRQALATALGIVAGCLFHASYCILGLALIITKSVLLFSVIKYAGAGYLIYLGIKGLTSKPTAANSVSVQKETSIKSVRESFVEGFFCNVLNPKLAVFLLSLFTQFVSLDASLIEKGSVAGVFVLEAAIYWPLLVILLQSSLIRRLFSDAQLYVDRFCGALLIYLGVRVAFSRD
jgi:RhtB (resistance to homoserine/threonine) family protein